MSIPAALTALLSLGPAYGLQLHSELGTRLAHRANTNVGQIYSTLDRLVRDGLVERRGETEDGLPLYALTDQGRSSVTQWLGADWVTPATSWSDVLDVLQLGATLPGFDPEPTCARVEREFSEPLYDSPSLAERASTHFATAVRAVVTDIRAARDSGTLPQTPLTTIRPTRGRRPA